MSLLYRFPYFAQRKSIDVNLLALVYNNFLLKFQNDLRFVVSQVQLRGLNMIFRGSGPRLRLSGRFTDPAMQRFIDY